MAKNRMDGDGLSHLLEKIKAYITGVLPTKTSQLTNDSGYLTSSTGVTSVNSQTGAVTIGTATTTTEGLMSTDDKTKLNGIATGAEVNQNAFSIVQVGTTKVQADSKTDTLTLEAGDNVTLTPDATNDKVTIAVTPTIYDFDEEPTNGSDNPVTSDGIYAALTGKQNALTFDSTPTSGSANPVTSGGVYTALGNKVSKSGDTMTGMLSFAGGGIELTGESDSSFIEYSSIGTAGAYLGGIWHYNGNNVNAELATIGDIQPQVAKIWTGTCSTAAGTAAKTVTLDEKSGFTLATGRKVAVTFTNGNSAASPTLNVNSTGAKNIAYPTATNTFVTSGGSTYNAIAAGETIILTYDGTRWVKEPSMLALYTAYKTAQDAAPKASPALTGTPTAPTAAAGTNTTQIATTAFVTTAVANAVTGTASFQGTVNTGADISGLTSYTKGMYWIVGTAGTYVGQKCEAGDMIYCISDYSSSYKASDFNVVQNNTEALTNDEIDTIWNGVFS